MEAGFLDRDSAAIGVFFLNLKLSVHFLLGSFLVQLKRESEREGKTHPNTARVFRTVLSCGSKRTADSACVWLLAAKAIQVT